MIGFYTLFKKEILRFWKVGFQTLAAPMITALLYQLIFSHAVGKSVEALPDNLRAWQQPAADDTVLLKLDDYEQLAFVLQTLKYAGVKVKHMQLPETDLEDVFVKIMRK